MYRLNGIIRLLENLLESEGNMQSRLYELDYNYVSVPQQVVNSILHRAYTNWVEYIGMKDELDHNEYNGQKLQPKILKSMRHIADTKYSKAISYFDCWKDITGLKMCIGELDKFTEEDFDGMI